jgi:integrase
MARTAGSAPPTRSDWADFVRWCVARGEAALPASPETVIEYLEDLDVRGDGEAGERRVRAIGSAHKEAGIATPTDDDRVRAVATRVRWRQRRPAVATAAIEHDDLELILDALPSGIIGDRDRALLLIGARAALRPSELVALDVADLTVVRGGLAVSLLRERVVIPRDDDPVRCPVLAWQEWVAAAGLTTGPAFRAIDRSGRLGLTRLGEKAITRIVRRAADRAGLDEHRYSALSLRLGDVRAPS